MKNTLNKIFVCFALISTIGFTNCNDSSDDLPLELTIQDKVALLEGSEWLVKDFEDRVMRTFISGERHTYYGSDSVFSDTAIPGTEAYTITGELLTIDFNFGNVFTYELEFSCDNNIVEFYKDGVLNTTLYKRGSNYEACL
jgi:hypothetical protein